MSLSLGKRGPARRPSTIPTPQLEADFRWASQANNPYALFYLDVHSEYEVGSLSLVLIAILLFLIYSHVLMLPTYEPRLL
jgi:hypothetical protein